MKKPTKKYGFFTAVAMVVGIVIGSGVFKSAGGVLEKTNGNLPLALLAWLIGGLIMVVSVYSISLLAVRVEKSSGVVDYVEDAFGEKAGYLVAWFMNFVYYPTLVGILAWLGGTIIATMLGTENPITGNLTWGITLVLFLGTYLLNILSPILAGKWQVSAMSIKLIPLGLIAIVGLVVGLLNGHTVESFNYVSTSLTGGSLATAVAVTAFAYEGWIVATTINSELVDSKKTLPKALILGSLIVLVTYLLFFIGLSGVISTDEAVSLSGSLETSVLAGERLFGTVGGSIVSVMILISVLGTLNGLTMGAARGMHSISIRGLGPKPEFFQKLSKSGATVNSALLSIVIGLLWMIVWYGNFQGWFGGFMDTSILPIVFLGLSYLLIYFHIAKDFDDLNILNRYIVPSLATLGSGYLIYGAYQSDPKMFGYFSILVVMIMFIGILTYKPKLNAFLVKQN